MRRMQTTRSQYGPGASLPRQEDCRPLPGRGGGWPARRAAGPRGQKGGAKILSGAPPRAGGNRGPPPRAAEITISRESRMNRQSGAPMEGRAVLAHRDYRLDEIVVYASTQTPHTVRVAIAENLGLDERRPRVVAPDVGGGFGPKARLHPEEINLPAP